MGLMAMLTNEDMEVMKANTKTMELLTDMQVIMLALSALVMEAENMPPGTRLPLHAALRARTGLRTDA